MKRIVLLISFLILQSVPIWAGVVFSGPGGTGGGAAGPPGPAGSSGAQTSADGSLVITNAGTGTNDFGLAVANTNIIIQLLATGGYNLIASNLATNPVFFTNSGVKTNSFVNQTAWIDVTYGNDATAILNDRLHPAQTVLWGMTNCPVGGTINIAPGYYDISNCNFTSATSTNNVTIRGQGLLSTILTNGTIRTGFNTYIIGLRISAGITACFTPKLPYYIDSCELDGLSDIENPPVLGNGATNYISRSILVPLQDGWNPGVTVAKAVYIFKDNIFINTNVSGNARFGQFSCEADFYGNVFILSNNNAGTIYSGIVFPTGNKATNTIANNSFSFLGSSATTNFFLINNSTLNTVNWGMNTLIGSCALSGLFTRVTGTETLSNLLAAANNPYVTNATSTITGGPTGSVGAAAGLLTVNFPATVITNTVLTGGTSIIISNAGTDTIGGVATTTNQLSVGLFGTITNFAKAVFIIWTNETGVKMSYKVHGVSVIAGTLGAQNDFNLSNRTTGAAHQLGAAGVAANNVIGSVGPVLANPGDLMAISNTVSAPGTVTFGKVEGTPLP